MRNIRMIIEKEISKEIEIGSHLKAQDRAMRLNDIMGWVDMYAKQMVRELNNEALKSLKGERLLSELSVEECNQRIGQLDLSRTIDKKVMAL